jgi:outer membrane protein
MRIGRAEANRNPGRSRRLLAATVVVAGIMAGPLGAEEQGPTTPKEERVTVTLTLDEAVAEALAHAPALQAVAQQEQQARSRAAAARRARFGEVDAVAGYTHYQDDQIVRPIARQLLAEGIAGLPFDRDQWRYGLTLQVPLYLGGRLSASIAVASLQADQAAALLDGTRWQTRFNVASLYASGQTLDALVRAIDANLMALEETGRKVDLAVQVGKRPELDHLKIAGETASIRARRADAEASRARVGAVLLALLGRDPASTLRLAPLADRPATLAGASDDLRGLALAASPVRQATLGAQQAHQATRIARSAFLPSLGVHAQYLRSDAPSVGAPLDTWDVSVGLTMPVFAGGSRWASLAAAHHGEAAAQSALTRVRLEQEARLVEAQARWDAARVALDAAASGVAAARETARIEQVRYDSGAGAIDDLLRARARELSAEVALAQARGDRAIAAARINSVCEKEVVP